MPQAPNSQLTLTGSKSSSPNGALLSYLWRITPYGSTAPGAGITASGPTATLTSPAVGQYNVTLQVWDVLGGYASNITALSVDTANVLDWWSATPSFAAPAPASAPRPSAVLALNGSRSNTMTIKARSNTLVYIEFDASASADGRSGKLAYAWKITQTQPTVAPMDLMLPYKQPARFTYA